MDGDDYIDSTYIENMVNYLKNSDKKIWGYGVHFERVYLNNHLNIIGKKNASESENNKVKYYLNDGIYGAINNKEREQATIHIKPLQDKETSEIPSIFFGPTCDSYDTIANDILFPEYDIGDWLYIENMGAYTKAGACDFNGFLKSISFYYTTV